MFTITNSGSANFEVILDKFIVVRIRTSENYTWKWISKLCNY